jgi:hypothetical protein
LSVAPSAEGVGAVDQLSPLPESSLPVGFGIGVLPSWWSSVAVAVGLGVRGRWVADGVYVEAGVAVALTSGEGVPPTVS